MGPQKHVISIQSCVPKLGQIHTCWSPVHKVKREEKQHAPLGALSAELSAGKPNPKKSIESSFLYCLWCVEGWNIWIRSWKLRLDCIIQISLPWTSPLYKVSALLILDTQFTVNLWAIFSCSWCAGIISDTGLPFRALPTALGVIVMERAIFWLIYFL